MTKHDFYRLLIHILPGAVSAWIMIHSSLAGLVSVCLFVLYERWQGRIKKDRGYKDLVGFVWGFNLLYLYAILSKGGIF